MLSVIAAPEVPERQRGFGSIQLRYEDLAQDGRPRLEALAGGISVAVWQGPVRQLDAASMIDRGIIPILTRIVIEAHDGPFAVENPIDAIGCYEGAHSVATTGDRLYLNMWADMTAPVGRTILPAPSHAGVRVPAGRMHAEHVFTKPFAPKEHRRVSAADLSQFGEFPGRLIEARPYASVVDLSDCRGRDEGFVAQSPVAFGMRHTDSNQHVNSLVYFAVLEEAVLEALASRKRDTRVMARAIEIAYRKPCFAGQVMMPCVRIAEADDGVHAACVLVPLGGDPNDLSQAHVYAQLVMR
jgi:hypothetical protein